MVEQEHTVEVIGQHGECLQYRIIKERARGWSKFNYKKLVRYGKIMLMATLHWMLIPPKYGTIEGPPLVLSWLLGAPLTMVQRHSKYHKQYLFIRTSTVVSPKFICFKLLGF